MGKIMAKNHVGRSLPTATEIEDSILKNSKLILFQNVPYFIGILFLLPMFFRSNISKRETDMNILSIVALRSSIYHDALVASVAISCPMILDLIIDTWSGTKATRQGFISRWVLLFGLIIPNTLEIVYVIPNNMLQLHWFLMHTQALFTTCAILGYLYNFGAPVWTLKRTSWITFFAGLCISLHLYSEKPLREFEPINTVCFIGFIVLTIGVVALSRLWFLRVMRTRTTAMLSPDQYCCLIYMWAMIVTFAVLLFIFVYFSKLEIMSLDASMVSTFTILMSLVTLAISALHSRRARLEVADTKVRHT